MKCHSSPTQPPNVSEFKDEKFLAAVKRLQAVYDETQSAWLKKIGLGIVCVCKDGITEQSLVGYYWGKMCAPHDTCCYHALTNVRYTQSEWLEKESGKSSSGDDVFYNLSLEIPACTI